MQLEYALTSDDYLKFNEYHMKHSPTIRRSKSIFFLAPTFTGIFMSLVLSHGHLKTMVLTALVPIVWLCIAPAYWRHTTRKRINKMMQEGDNSHSFDRQTLSITPEGIASVSETAEGKIKWKAVNKVVTSEAAIYLYVGPMKGFIVPNTVFASDTQRQEFLEMVLRYREQAAGLVEVA